MQLNVSLQCIESSSVTTLAFLFRTRSESSYSSSVLNFSFLFVTVRLLRNVEKVEYFEHVALWIKHKVYAKETGHFIHVWIFKKFEAKRRGV